MPKPLVSRSNELVPRHGEHSPASFLKIGAEEIVRSSAAAPIDFKSGRANQIAICIKSAQYAALVRPHFGLNLLQRVFGDKKRSFHRSVMSPKPHRAPSGIKKSGFDLEISMSRSHPYGFVAHTSGQRPFEGLLSKSHCTHGICGGSELGSFRKVWKQKVDLPASQRPSMCPFAQTLAPQRSTFK